MNNATILFVIFLKISSPAFAQESNNTWLSVPDTPFTHGIVNAMASVGDDLYVGGYTSSESSIQHLARYDTKTGEWSAVGGGINGVRINALLVHDNYLYVGGQLTFPVEPVETITRYNLETGEWSSLGSNITGTIYAIAYHDGYIYAGGSGSFDIEGFSGLRNIARYHLETEEWHGIGWGTVETIHSMAFHDGYLYAGGNFNRAGGFDLEYEAHNVARSNLKTGEWSSVGEGLRLGTVNDMFFHNGYLYAGGTFSLGYGTEGAKHLYRFDLEAETWSAIEPAPDFLINVFAVQDDIMYAGGGFQLIGDIGHNRVAAYDLNTGTWLPRFEGGVNGGVRALTFIDGDLYAGGQFSWVYGSDSNCTDYGNPESGLKGLLCTNGDETGSVSVWKHGVSASSTEDSNESLPLAVSLSQNYPNPFNPTTTIKFGLPFDSEVHLVVYNLLGQKVGTLINSSLRAGRHQVSFNAANLTSGVYLYRLKAGDHVETRQMMLIR